MANRIVQLLAFLDALPKPKARLALISLAVCLASFLFAPASAKRAIAPDYEPQVRNLLAGHGFTSPSGETLHRYPPAYPAMLASIRLAARASGLPEITILFVFAALCTILACLFLHAIVDMVLPVPGAFAAGLLFAVHPHVLYGALLPLSETPFTLFLLASIFCSLWASSGRTLRPALFCLLAGVLSGLAALTRPTGLLIPLLLALGVGLHGIRPVSARLRASAILLAAALLTVAPWQAFLWRNTGRFIPISSAAAASMRDGFTFNQKAMRDRIALPAGVEWVSRAVWSKYPDLDSISRVLSLMKKLALERPGAVLQTYTFKAARSWYGTDSQKPLPERVNQVLAIFLLLPAALGVFRYFQIAGADRAPGLLLVVVILYFWAACTVFHSLARYMMPAIGLLLAFVPLAFHTPGGRANQPRDADRSGTRFA